MKIALHRLMPTMLLIIVGMLLSLNAATPNTARAMTQRASVQAAALADSPTAISATPVSPGPTTAPPELSLTEGFTYTTSGCLIPTVTVTLGLANSSGVNTPADTTLLVSLSHLSGNTINDAGHLTLQSINSTGAVTVQSYSVTLVDGTIHASLGAIAAGSSGSVVITLSVNPRTINGDLGLLSAQVVESPPPDGTGEVLSNVLQNVPLQATINCPPPTYPAATQTPTAAPTSTATTTSLASPTAVPPTAVPPTAVPPTAVPPTAVPPTAVPPTAVPPTAVPPTAIVPLVVVAAAQQNTPAPTYTPLPTYAPLPTYTPLPTYAPLPTYTPAPSSTATPHLAGITRPVSKRVVTITRYVTKPRYVTKVRYIIQTIHKVVTTQKVNTVVRYQNQMRIRVVTHVNNKTVVRYVTKVVIQTRTVIHNVTRVHEVRALRIVRHPTTGRFAGPAQVWRGALPPVEARFDIARLGISWAPVWARDFIPNGWNSFTYDIVPAYGVTRFSPSAPFGQPGLSMISGHDDIYGSIFKDLGKLRLGDAIVVTQGVRAHVYHYIVTSVRVVTPDDVAMLNAPYAQPTLALISCTPYRVDTHRVVVIARLQQ